MLDYTLRSGYSIFTELLKKGSNLHNLSESGCPGFQDVQDDFFVRIRMSRISGCPGFQDVQDKIFSKLIRNS